MSKASKAVSAHDFRVGEAVVYPGRGVGRVAAIECQEVAGFSLEVYVISFELENAVLKIPTSKASKQGLRGVSDAATIDKALDVLNGRSRKPATLWSRRVQELEAKLASGDIIQVSQVAREMYRVPGVSEQSFSARLLSETAASLIAQELAASRDIKVSEAMALIQECLERSALREAAGGGGHEEGSASAPDGTKASGSAPQVRRG